VRHAARSVVAATGPAVAIALAWGSLESPVAWSDLVAAAVLGVLPAALVHPLLRGLGALTATVLALSLAFAVSPLEALPWTAGTWLGEIGRVVAEGLRAFEVAGLPFDPSARPAMHALTQTAVFGFSLAAGLAVAWRRPLLAGLAVVVGGGWATASTPDERLVLMGVLLLLATLWPLVVLRIRTRRDAVAACAAVAAVTVAGVGTAAAGAAPETAALDWRSWSVVGSSRDRLGVRYVWDAQYDGIEFPARPTTVLRVQGPRRARYWRASTLDLFAGHRWLESLYLAGSYSTPFRLPADPLLPAASRHGRSLVRQVVEVAALDDDHLVAAGQAMRLESSVIDEALVFQGGVLRVRRNVPSGARYAVWSYAPQPSPRQLLASRPNYPDSLQRYLAIDRGVAPFFGAPSREREIARHFEDPLYAAFWPYRPLWREARRLTAGLRSPYEATLAVERWLRASGGFRYEEHPPTGGFSGAPLVDFVVRHRSGYCQHFAGTMALMLRLLGIPARVAVGFTSGKWSGGEWIVSDADAHAWVEAWFEGHGWLPFDPTPGRGSFSASYTFASDSADAVQALGRGDLLAVLPEGTFDNTPTGTGSVEPEVTEAASRPLWPFAVVVPLLLAPALLLLVKTTRRRLRYRARDPRRVAGAARAELVDLLRDQGAEVGSNVGSSELRIAVERHLGVPGAPFVGAHARARYGPPSGAAAAASEVRSELGALKRLAWEQLGPGTRLRGAFSLRSLRRA
jgi:transglutaminase-like putative cysteine protease